MYEPRATVTVVVPTYNGEDYLDRLLCSVAGQQYDGEVEVLIVDSGSTDNTLQIIAKHSEVRLVQIPNTEFGHGRTRAMAADLAAGQLVVFLTQDAVPASDSWLAELVAPFDIDDRIVLVTGRQAPRDRAFPLQRFEIIGVFSALGPDDGITIFGAGSTPLQGAAFDRAAFHSDVNAAVRKELLATVPFRDVRYSEDQLMGRDVLAAGFWKAYAGRAVVEHSNDLTLHEYGKRIFDETVGLRRIGTPIPPLGRLAQIRMTLRGALGDSLRIARDGTLRGRARWFFDNPRYHQRKWSSYRRASRVALDDAAAQSAHSLEESRRAQRS